MRTGSDRWLNVDLQAWRNLFTQIQDAVNGSGSWPKIRLCAMAWHVAGILYEKHQKPPLADTTYDALARHLLDNYAQAVAAGADVQEDELRAGTAQRWAEFPSPAHDVAYALAQRRTKAKPDSSKSIDEGRPAWVDEMLEEARQQSAKIAAEILASLRKPET